MNGCPQFCFRNHCDFETGTADGSHLIFSNIISVSCLLKGSNNKHSVGLRFVAQGLPVGVQAMLCVRRDLGHAEIKSPSTEMLGKQRSFRCHEESSLGFIYSLFLLFLFLPFCQEV